MEPIKEEEFKGKVKVRFNNINEGFDNYKNGILRGGIELKKSSVEDQIIKFLQGMFDLNGEENSYVDFYYFRLNEEDKEKLTELLSKEDKITLDKLKGYDTIYFKLSRDVIPFIARLCTREVLFSTIYFTKMPCTIWGNYDLKFPCFFEDELSMKTYRELSNKYSLDII